MKAKDQISAAETASTAPKTHTKHALDGEIIKVHKGVAIYKTHASPFWFARIRDPQAKKYVVRSTKATSRIKAREIATPRPSPEPLAASTVASSSSVLAAAIRRWIAATRT